VKLANVRQIASADGAQLLRPKRGDGDGFAGQGHELDFVGFAAAVDVDNRANVTRFEALAWQIFGKNDRVVFADHQVLGYAVTSRGATAP
jgi:hypothetical protein